MDDLKHKTWSSAPHLRSCCGWIKGWCMVKKSDTRLEQSDGTITCGLIYRFLLFTFCQKLNFSRLFHYILQWVQDRQGNGRLTHAEAL
jgi:hypothetical protein